MIKHIYSVLIAERRRRGLSQSELAARAGLRREKVNRIESKAEGVGIEELSRLLDAVGLELVVREKGQAASAASSKLEKASPAHSARRLAPQAFHKASFIDGSKAKILHWGKVPR
jgi:HTH-type transcriptional regulator/antitoxin HipB